MALEDFKNVAVFTHPITLKEVQNENIAAPSTSDSNVHTEFSFKVEPIIDKESIKKEMEINDDTPLIWRPSDLTIKIEPFETEIQQRLEPKPIVDIYIKEEPQAYDDNENDGNFEFGVARGILNSDLSKCLGTLIQDQDSCNLCQKRFATKGNLQRHMLIHSRDKFECDSCFRQFGKKEQLLKHIESHNKEKKYHCVRCDKMFRTSSNLEQHKRVHLDIKPFQCETCLKRFAIRPYLLKHQTKSRCKRPSDEPLICKFCNKIFEKEILLRSHLRRHTTEKPYTCETCNMNFKYKSTVVRHLQLHNGVRPYKCKYCPKTFTTAGLLKPHLRVHTGERPFQCPMCERCFTHKHNMCRHLERHKKIKNLVCGICKKKFPKESRLVYHMKVHTNARPFACEICPKRFAHKQNVVRHYKRKHPNEKYNSTDTDASVARTIAKGMIWLPDLPSVEPSCETILP